MEKISYAIDLMKKTSNIKIIEKSKNKLKIQIIKGSNKIVSIPLKLSRNLSYIVAAIMCDGHIRRDKYRIVFENVNKNIIIKFIEKIYNSFETKTTYRIKIDKRVNRKTSYIVTISSKPIVIFLNKIFKIPRGKKSHIIEIPKIIKKSRKYIKLAFIEGVFDTDGGKRGRGLGLSSASKQFRDDLAEILTEFNINVHKDEWINKKYNKKYYGLYFKSSEAGVPKWSKGQDYRF